MVATNGYISRQLELNESFINRTLSGLGNSPTNLKEAIEVKRIPAIYRFGNDESALLQVYEDGRTALHYALEYGSETCQALLNAIPPSTNVKELVSNYCKGPRVLTKEGEHLAHILAKIQYNDFTVEYLNQNPSCVKELNETGVTPLFIAVKNQPPVVDLLLSHGADVNCRDHSGKTPLHQAMMTSAPTFKEHIRYNFKIADHKIESQKSIIQSLIDKGASITEEDQASVMPIQLAAQYCDVEILSHCLSHYMSQRPLRNSKFESLLHYAVKGYSTENLVFLLGKGDEINSLTNQEKTPLMYAVEEGSLKVVEMLLCHGADFSIKDIDGKTAVHHAVYTDSTESLKLLIAAGADIDVEDASGECPLHVAVRLRAHNILHILLERGANMEVQRLAYPRTVLEIAERDKNTSAIQMLIFNAVRCSQCFPVVDLNLPENICFAVFHIGLLKSCDSKLLPLIFDLCGEVDSEKILLHPVTKLILSLLNCHNRLGLFIKGLLNLASLLALFHYLYCFAYNCLFKSYYSVYESRNYSLKLNLTCESEVSSWPYYENLTSSDDDNYQCAAGCKNKCHICWFIWVLLILPVIAIECIKISGGMKKYFTYSNILTVIYITLGFLTIPYVDVMSNLRDETAVLAMIITGLAITQWIGDYISFWHINVKLYQIIAVRMIKIFSPFVILLLIYGILFNRILGSETNNCEHSPENFGKLHIGAVLLKEMGMLMGELPTDNFPQNPFQSPVVSIIVCSFIFLIFIVLLNMVMALTITISDEVLKKAELTGIKSELGKIQTIQKIRSLIPCLNGPVDDVVPQSSHFVIDLTNTFRRSYFMMFWYYFWGQTNRNFTAGWPLCVTPLNRQEVLSVMKHRVNKKCPYDVKHNY